jgi:hypothetical protein
VGQFRLRAELALFASAGGPEQCRHCLRDDLPTIKAVPPRAFSTTHGRANDPEHKENNRDDPKQVDGEADAEEQ